jgi:transposase InsO family protein
MCGLLQVSRSAYYAWQKGESHRPRADEQAKEEALIAVFKEHKRRYGVRRIVAELQGKGIRISHHLARRLLRKWGLKAIQPRSFIPRTTDSRHSYAISPNLLRERPFPDGPNQVWVGDITYIPLKDSRWAYLAVWMDLFSRRIVGWSLEEHMREELVIAALQKALGVRAVGKGMILHSDRGGQYAGHAFRGLLRRRRLLQSMSRADDPYDNAFMESCFSRFKAELLQGGVFESIADAYTEIFEYIEMYYNPIRRHSSLGYVSPAVFEQQWVRAQTAPS